MRSILAFIRRDALIAASYRTAMVLSVLSLLTVVVPLFFIARAIQPVVEGSIQSEGGQYFAFVVAGLATFQFVSTAVGAVPNAVALGIRNGTLELQLASPLRKHVLVLGYLGYPLLWSMARGICLLLAGAALGADFHFARLPFVLALWVLIALSYLPFGVLAAALILLLRTAGPLPNAVLAGSMFLGGVYYPTHVIPSWLGQLSGAIPLTYGLRPLRQLLLQGAPLPLAARDIALLALFTAALLAISVLAFGWALKQARRLGTLAQY
jgi:ABC-2 type transport system permease protein